MTNTATLIPLISADFDTYCAIEDMVFAWFADEIETSFEEIAAFAASLGVLFTEWNLTSLGIDYDEL